MADKRIRGGYPVALFQTAIYWSWSNMKKRCYDTSTFNYVDYGGRGITVCEKWLSFAGFYDDMGASHQLGLTLDRIDNDKGYSKENCRWATRRVQANNRRSNRLFTFGGETKTLEEWIRDRGLKSSTVRQRFYNKHWSIERSLEMEVCHR